MFCRLEVVDNMSRVYPRWNARVWESGEFSLGYLPPKQVDRPPGVSEVLSDPEELEMMIAAIDAHGVEAMREFVKEHPEFYPGLKPPASPLDSSMTPNSHSGVIRGQKGMSGHGKKLVRNGCLRLEREAGVRHLSFLTLTVPGVSQEGAKVVVANWAEIVRVFQQRLKRHLQRNGLPGEIVGVTEVQEKRLTATGVIALHLHLVFQGRQKYGHWVLTPGTVRGYWRDALTPHLAAIEGEIYWDAVENLQPVRKSAVGYLGKYMSKGVAVCRDIIQNHPDVVLPACWYICTNTLRKRVMQHIMFLTSGHDNWFESMCTSEHTQGVFSYISKVYIKTSDGFDYQVGFVGRLDTQGLQEVLYAKGKYADAYHNSENL